MKDLQEATENICNLKGGLIAQQAVMQALLRALPPIAWPAVEKAIQEESEIARVVLLNGQVSEHVVAGFELGIQQSLSTLEQLQDPLGIRRQRGPDPSQ